MRPEEVMMIRLRKEVEAELADLQRLRGEHAGVPMGREDGYMLRAIEVRDKIVPLHEVGSAA